MIFISGKGDDTVEVYGDTTATFQGSNSYLLLIGDPLTGMVVTMRRVCDLWEAGIQQANAGCPIPWATQVDSVGDSARVGVDCPVGTLIEREI